MELGDIMNPKPCIMATTFVIYIVDSFMNCIVVENKMLSSPCLTLFLMLGGGLHDHSPVDEMRLIMMRPSSECGSEDSVLIGALLPASSES